jgi:hypothetical protein
LGAVAVRHLFFSELEAREKMRGHGKGRGRWGGEMGDRYKKKKRDFAGLVLDVLPHVFLDPTTNLGNFTVPNTPFLPFINPLFSFASCDDLEAEEGSGMSAVEPHGDTRRDDSPCAVLCPTHQGTTPEKNDIKICSFCQIPGRKSNAKRAEHRSGMHQNYRATVTVFHIERHYCQFFPTITQGEIEQFFKFNI